MTRATQSVPSLRIAALAKAGTTALYPRNAIIYRQAEAADSLYYLEEGLVKIAVASPQGKYAVIGVLGPDMFFGEACLAGHAARNATASTLIKSRLVHIRKTALLRLLRSDLSFAQQFTKHVARRAARVEEDVIDLLFNSTEKRLARALLLLAALDEDSDSSSVLDRITHQILAEMVGTSRPRISDFLSKFRRQGFISERAPLRVHSSLAKVMLED
jgi:CRP/FNR family cyclic AMP-dependent transcriptional regulator